MNEVLITQWLGWLEGGDLSPDTIRLRRILMWTFARHHDLAMATTADVQRHLATRPGGPWSRASHLATLRSFYRYGLRAGLVDHDPTLLVHPIRVPAGCKEPIPAQVIRQALATADRRARFMILLGARAGLRRAEIAALHESQISDTHLTITGKGRRVRVIPVHPDLRPYLRDVHGWAFASVKRPGEHLSPDQVANIVTAALGQPWTCHGLRRAFATAAFDGCLDIRAVQELLGHASVATTSRYVKANEASMRRAVLAVA